jgi:hypothetical protein
MKVKGFMSQLKEEDGMMTQIRKTKGFMTELEEAFWE